MAAALRTVMQKRSISLLQSIDLSQVQENQNEMLLENRAREEQERSDAESQDSDDESEASLKSPVRMLKKETSHLARDELQRKKTADMKREALFEKKIVVIRKKTRRLKIIDTIVAFVAMAGLLLAFIENENYYNRDGKGRNESSAQGLIMRGIITLLTAALLGLIVHRTYLSYQISIEQRDGIEVIISSYFKSKEFKLMWLEIAICIVHWPPNLDVELSFEQLGGDITLSMNAITLCIMILRSYLVFRLFKHYTKWSNEKAQRICGKNNCEASTMFACKAVLQERPYTVLTVCMSVSIVLFGFAARIFERPYSSEFTSDQDFDYAWNSMWLIVLTMTTVGYGDFFPRTHMGRFVIILACFWGIFLVSMMVVTLTISSEFTKGEARAYDILFRLNAKESAKNSAKFVIKSALQLNVIQKHKLKHPQYESMWIIKSNEMQTNIEKFRIQRNRAMKNDLPAEEMLRQLTEKIDIDLDEVKVQLSAALDLEEQLEKVEDSQTNTIDSLKSAITHTNELQELIAKFRSKNGS